MNSFAPSEIDKLPYVEHKPSDGRTVFLRSFFDHDRREWFLYLPVRPGELGRILDGEPVVSTYFSSAPAEPDRDVLFPLGNFIAQHLSWPRIAGCLASLESDVHHLSSVLEKYLLISNQPKRDRFGATQLLSSELEYLLVLLRSLYDLLQRLAKQASAVIRQPEAPHEPMVEDLPGSFADVVLHGDRLRTKAELETRFRLPLPLAQFYIAEGAHFRWLRDLRVSIEHHGKSVGTIFDLEEGMAVAVQEEPWKDLPIWRPEFVRNERLGSLRAVFLFLVSDALRMLAAYAHAYSSCIAAPPAVAPNSTLYLRDLYSHHLVGLAEAMKNPWERSSRDAT